MCNNCFEHEINSFPTNEEWLKFDLDLSKKLGKGILKYRDFRADRKRDKDDGEFIYECTFCKQNWKLREPDYSFRGYFINEKSHSI